MRNHEVIAEQKLLDVYGEIAEPGWARKQVWQYDRSDIKAPKFRIKEWDYYLIVGDDFAVATTISDDGYVGLQSVSLLELGDEPWEHTETVLNVFPMGKLHMPSNSSEGDVVYADKRLHMSYKLRPLGGQETVTEAVIANNEMNASGLIRHISCHFENFCDGKPFDCEIDLAQPDMDTMVIATPWDERHAFYYNQKINCMRASGWAMYDGKRYEFNPDRNYGTLDWGRGVWTYDNTWKWGSGNATVDGHSFGFNIGYGFGNTSAASENILFYDGVAHKLDDVTFNIPTDENGNDDYMSPWTFTSSDGRFEMEFTPILDRAACMDFKFIVSDQHQVFGRMSGKAVLDDGRVINVEDMLMFAEKVHNKY
ncbi:MAG: DUF2804 domain-containing protein [Lachnospiraceae bacterium]|nr:DUF2804 domain-containing protein [Lachnospiraceae bacterium]